MKLTNYVDKLLLAKDLQKNDAHHFFSLILAVSPDKFEEAEAGLALLHKKRETADELTQLVHLAKRKSKKLFLKINKGLVDGCGTGGDQKHTFNISTLACLVAASAGAYVAKHGNRSITSRCGSSDLMESLGISLIQHGKQLNKSLQNAHFAYFHAPYYTTAFRNVQPLRRALSKQRLKTIFNLVGPLLNPAKLEGQVIGVFDKHYLRVMAQALKQLGVKHALVIIGEDSTDELTIYQKTQILELKNNKIVRRTLDGKKLGFRRSHVKDLRGGSILKNRMIARNILSGKEKTAKLDTVLLNAAALLYVSGLAPNLKTGIQTARNVVASGQAHQTLSTLRRISNDSR